MDRDIHFSRLSATLQVLQRGDISISNEEDSTIYFHDKYAQNTKKQAWIYSAKHNVLKHGTKRRAQELFLGWSKVPNLQDYIIEIF